MTQPLEYSVGSSQNLREQNLRQLIETLKQADVVMLSFDLDGVIFSRYDEQGRIFDEERGNWVDPYLNSELKTLGIALDFLRITCENQGKKFIVALNTNREIEIAYLIFNSFPLSVRGHLLSSLEAGHALSYLKDGEIVSRKLTDEDPHIHAIKQNISQDMDDAYSQNLMGKRAYKPFRQGMVTFRGVSPEFVGWDEKTQIAKGPISDILTKYNYPKSPDIGIAYYPFDGGLDIYFPKFSKQSGEEALVDLASEAKLIDPNERVVQIHFGDSISDNITGHATSPKGICYDVFTIAVANSDSTLSDVATLATASTHRWGVYESIRLLEDMIQQRFEEKTTNNQSLAQLLISYLGSESPTPEDFNLKEVIKNIDLAEILALVDKIKIVQNNKGRIFLIGNGGSYDNARLTSLLLRMNGVDADVPGSGQKYLEAGLRKGHQYVFSSALEDQKLNENDLVIAFSGSGNSPNILDAIRYAQNKKVSVFALGGGDGGKMCQLAGSENCSIAKSTTMEVIEDIHAVIGFITATSVTSATQKESILPVLEKQKRQAENIISQILKQENIQKLAKLLLNIEKTLATKGRIIFIGDSIGVNHVRADLARGATNQLPFSFRVVENLGSTNSSMATQNDDGPNFVLVHALENIRPSKDDVVIILNSPARSQDKNLAMCLQLAQDSQATTFIIGDGLSAQTPDVNFSGSQAEFELMTTILADLFGRTLHDHLINSLKVEIQEFSPQDLSPELQTWLTEKIGSDKKLGKSDIIKLESQLRAIGQLPQDKVITFCYGKMFIVDSPEKFGLERTFY